MAKILERLIDSTEQEEEGQQDFLQAEETQEPVISSEEEPDIPDKYKSKSAEELVRMHQEAEKLLGRQSAEVGELRKVVDNYIQTQLTHEEQAPTTQSEEIDFFAEPEKAINQAIENHPKIKEAENITNQYRQSTALSELERKHPDMKEILQDVKFAEWIQASKTRTRLFVEADQQYNHESADELFSLWKERQNIVKQTAQAETQARKQAVKSASTGNARGSAEKASKKIYRRADIIRLLKTDPERYASLSPEILKAYSEGRVK
jgi:primosomal protein N'|tara:strand:- start:11 stop:802 length:792 start_codon:yes stop_codon:yes gene_type:complete